MELMFTIWRFYFKFAVWREAIEMDILRYFGLKICFGRHEMLINLYHQYSWAEWKEGFRYRVSFPFISVMNDMVRRVEKISQEGEEYEVCKVVPVLTGRVFGKELGLRCQKS